MSLARPNVLRFSGGAPLDRESYWAESSFQKSHDLVGAKRRPLQPLVGRTGKCKAPLFGCRMTLSLFLPRHY